MNTARMGVDDYAYINARVRAMQSRLLDPPSWERLVARNTITDFVDDLMQSPYAEALSFPSLRNDAQPSRVDEALRRDLTACLAKLRDITADRPRELMEAVLLRWDAYNLKTVLRGKRAAAPIEEILASTFPVGRLDEIALAELTRAPTLQGMADTLATWRAPIARPLHDGLRLLGEADTLQPLEFELDRWVFSEACRMVANGDGNDQVVRAYLRLLVDKTNLLTALRYPDERSVVTSDAARYFLDAKGQFTQAQYKAVAGARDLRHALSVLEATPFGWLAGTFAEGEPLSLPRLERALDRAIVREAISLSRRDPLGIGIAIAYLERKLNEVRNLRMIQRGQVLGIDLGQMMDWLIV